MAEDVELAESASMAMVLVLETPSPTERAVFVLREAFDVGYDEIAAAVGKNPAAARQIAHRAPGTSTPAARAGWSPRPGPGRPWSFYLGGSAKAGVAIACEPTAVNGDPALAVYLDGAFDGVMALRVVDGRITGLSCVRNPEKLTRFTAETPLTLR